MRKLRHFLILISCIFFSFTSFATHIIGGEMIVTCVGDSTFQIKLILYRDCTSGTAFDDPICVGIFDSDGDLYTSINISSPDITSIEIVSPDPCITIPPGLCVEQAIYEAEYTLPSSTETYSIVYQRCCRNAGIVNIIDPESAGASYVAEIPAVSEHGCNSSPYFNNYPPTALCVGSPINFDHSATDPDDDSLAYKFYTPFEGGDALNPAPCPPLAPEDFDEIDWETGYDIDYPIDASPILTIDPATGFLTGTPTAEGRYVVGIAVEEWRDEVLLSTHYRDFQFNIQTCIPTTLASTAEYILNCEDYSITFENFSEGADFYLWDFGDGTTSEEFEPTHVYADTGTYYVTLIANPGFDCADTFVAEIQVYNTLTADYEFSAGCSGEPVVFNDESISTGAGDIISWAWDFGDGGTSFIQNPEHSYDVGGIYVVTLTVTTDKGCESTISFDVDLLSGPDAEFSYSDVCQNETAEFENETTIPTGVTIEEYAWSFGDGNIDDAENPEHNYDAPGDYDVTLIVTSANGCKDTVIHTIHIGELPFANAGADDTVAYLEEYTLNGSGNGTFQWNPFVLVSDAFIANPEIRPAATFTYILEVTSPDGCVGYDSVTIFVIDRTIVELPNAFSPNGDGINDEIFILNHSVSKLLEYSIYNRWGQQVFTTTDLNAGWDGTINGKEAELGTYAFVIRAIDLSGSELLKNGNITLVR